MFCNNLYNLIYIGKPGVICVEGTLSNVQKYITRLKSLNWQRLTVRIVLQIQTFIILILT